MPGHSNVSPRMRGGVAVTKKKNVSEDEQYWTPHHIRAAITPTGVVLLDMKRNRYMGLGMTEARALAALAPNWPHASTEGQPLQALSRERALLRVAAFVEAGLLSRDPPEAGFSTTTVDLTAQLTSIGLQDQATVPIRPHHIVNFIRACVWAKWVLRSRTLYSVACEISAAKKTQGSSASNLQCTIALVCIFRRLRPYAFESRDRCLFHALALLRFLSRYASHPTWVIGVSARPWAAHSWLQVDNCLLDSSPEEVCSFTPILAI
jgi:hypothetical protein